MTPSLIPRSHALILWGLMALVGTPHLLRLSPAIILLTLILFAWCGFSLWRRGHLPLPSPTVLVLLVVVALATLFISAATLISRESGVALLLMMLLLKMLEMRTLRDLYFLTLWLFFFALSHVLFSQTVAIALYVLGCLMVLLTFVIYLARPQATLGDSWRLTVTLILQAMPVMLFLFLFFPRLPGPLLALPQETSRQSALSGLSDSMEPGTISQLTLSDQVAFRVEFPGEPPESGHRYWRGPVLWTFLGRTWRTAPTSQTDEENGLLQDTSPVLNYWVTLEPHHRHWLFALDMPGTPPTTAKRLADYQWRSERPIAQRYRYKANSHLRYRADLTLPPQLERMGLQLPQRGNKRATQLARHWVEQSQGNPRQVVQTALSYFNTEPFYYTLEPPLLGKEAIDEFLFTSRQGFCEHYAGAFTFLMRSAGIPARVVTGYLGGEIHPLGDHMTVRQSDAHAWSEVWLAGEGWRRVDPTAAIAPQRVERGNSRAASVLHQTTQTIDTWPWFLNPWQIWDAVDNRWNLWILGYGREQQVALFTRFGGDGSWKQLTLAMITTVAMALAGVALYLTWQYRPWQWRRQVVLRHYDTFCRRMARLGSPRAPHEGPLDYANRLATTHPAHAHWVWRVTRAYIALRYDQKETKEALHRLEQLVHQEKIC